MGMCTHIYGFRKPDKKFQIMKNIYDLCTEANIDIPDKVQEFFGWEAPEDTGIKVFLVFLEEVIEDVKGFEMKDAWQIEVSKIPKGVTHIRFENIY